MSMENAVSIQLTTGIVRAPRIQLGISKEEHVTVRKHPHASLIIANKPLANSEIRSGGRAALHERLDL